MTAMSDMPPGGAGTPVPAEDIIAWGRAHGAATDCLFCIIGKCGICYDGGCPCEPDLPGLCQCRCRHAVTGPTLDYDDGSSETLMFLGLRSLEEDL